MAQFQAISPGVQVNGETVLAIVEGMGAFKANALQILAECGIKDPKPGQWYPQQNWLNAFKLIAQKLGAATLGQIGRAIPENAKFPPEIDCIEKALGSIDAAYHMNHKGGQIGTYKFEKTGERTATVVCDNPYPCDFDKGLIQAMANKFAPKGTTRVSVMHDPSKGCRKNGDKSCTYSVKW
jgi:hypothetical protein